MIKQGALFRHDFGPRQNHLQEGVRPALVIQTDKLNDISEYPNVVVVPVTTKKRNSPTYVELQPSGENGLEATSWAITNQPFTIPKADLKEPLGWINSQELYGVKAALRIVLNL